MNQVARKIVAEIQQQGAIPFKRFMELALYCPVYGYYEKEGDTLGRRGDYYTSVSVGPLFGELLAWQFSEWLDQRHPMAEVQGAPTDSEYPLALVEAGAHQGDLAGDILRWLREQRAQRFEEIEYWIVEPSHRRRERQRQALAEFQTKVRWADTFAEIGQRGTGGESPRDGSKHGFGGVIFSNELLDAMPVHRLGWDARRGAWFEWGVSVTEAGFVWVRLDRTPQTDLVNRLEHEATDASAFGAAASIFTQVERVFDPELLARLPDGFTVELCPAATQWWAEAAGLLTCGKLLAIDYGFIADEWIQPERREGTLRAYCRHRLSTNVLAAPGEQDITAHVNFSLLRQAGEVAGLRTENLVTQEQFLTGIAAKVWESSSAFGAWTASRTRQFQTLTHPEHLGLAFRVLVQSKTAHKKQEQNTK